MKDAEKILAGSSLSGVVLDRIRSLLEASKLDGERAADVARELVAHFEDGLAAGRSADDATPSNLGFLLAAMATTRDVATIDGNSVVIWK